MMEFQQTVGSEKIYGELFGLKNAVAKARLIYLHGAGKKGILHFPLTPQFEAREFSVANFHFSGCGKSSGSFEASSLEKRFLEAKAVIEQHGDLANLTLSSASMGGHLALKLLENFDVKNLILFCPAIYDRDAFSVPFNQDFSEIIRKPDSWKNTDVLEPLQKYRGKLMIVIGDSDEVIPKGVIELLDQNSGQAAKKEIVVLKDCPHWIGPWLEARPEESEKLAEKIINFIYE